MEEHEERRRGMRRRRKGRGSWREEGEVRSHFGSSLAQPRLRARRHADSALCVESS